MYAFSEGMVLRNGTSTMSTLLLSIFKFLERKFLLLILSHSVQTMSSDTTHLFRTKSTPSLFPAFKDVMMNSNYIEVDSFSCIPFASIRKTTQTCVLRFVSILFGRGANQLVPSEGGIACGSDTAIVVFYSGSGRIHVKTNFQERGLKSTTIEKQIKNTDSWYGIV